MEIKGKSGSNANIRVQVHNKEGDFLMLRVTLHNEDIAHKYLCINKKATTFMKQNFR